MGVVGAVVRQMFASKDTGSSTVTIDLGRETFFLAWGVITFVDSLNDFDRDNAFAIDIPFVNGVRQPGQLFGGDHLGPLDPPGQIRNLYPGAAVRFGRRVTFRLRAFHSSDLVCFGHGVVIFDITNF
jgi:hypothetical protein